MGQAVRFSLGTILLGGLLAGPADALAADGSDVAVAPQRVAHARPDSTPTETAGSIAGAEVVDLPEQPKSAPVSAVSPLSVPTDPVFGVLNTYLKERESREASRVPETLPGASFVIHRNERWQTPPEFAGPTSPRPLVRSPEDPEFPRVLDVETNDPVAHAAAQTTKLPAKNAPRRDDPEQFARWADESDSSANAPAVRTNPANATTPTRIVITTPAPKDDLARFPSGEGLDGEAAEVVAQMAWQERKDAEAARAAKATEAAKSAADALERAIEKDAPRSPELKAAMAKIQEAMAQSKDGAPKTPGTSANPAGPATAAKPGAPAKPGETPELDPEKVFDDLIAEVGKNKEKYKQELERAQSSTRETLAAHGDDLRMRSARAARAAEVLLGKTPLTTIAGRISDMNSKQLLAARVRIVDDTDTASNAKLPEGFWCEGDYKVPVVSGVVKVEISRGRFYPTYVKGIEAKAGAANGFETLVSRPPVMNFAAEGWHLADLDLALGVRPNEQRVWFGGSPTLKDLILAARAEGVSVVGVPVPCESEAATRAFEAELAAAQNPNVLLIPVFPGPRHPFLGDGLGLGVKSCVGLPVDFGVPEQPLRDAFDEIRNRGGLAVFNTLAGTRNASVRNEIYSVLPRLEKTQFLAGAQANVRVHAAVGLPFEAVAGPSFDAIAFDGSEESEAIWFNLLNNGYSISAFGTGGGSIEGGRLPFGQTFVQVQGLLNREKVLDAIKAGRTGISFGPAVFCKILERDMGPGSVLPNDGRPLTLQVRAFSSMEKGVQLDSVEIIRNGNVIHTMHPSEGESHINDFRWPIQEMQTGWYMVRVSERQTVGTSVQRGGRAWTSPIYFRGAAFAAPDGAETRVRGKLTRGLTPTAGQITVMVPNRDSVTHMVDATGIYDVTLPSEGTLIFAAQGCEPVAKRVFEHPRVQQAVGALQAERGGKLSAQLSKPIVFGAWKLLLSELEWNIALMPTERAR